MSGPGKHTILFMYLFIYFLREDNANEDIFQVLVAGVCLCCFVNQPPEGRQKPERLKNKAKSCHQDSNRIIYLPHFPTTAAQDFVIFSCMCVTIVSTRETSKRF